MKHNLVPVRPAIAAITAALAFSSTPLLAQTTDTGAAQPAPVITPASPAAEPAAPAAAVQSVAPETVAPAPIEVAPQPPMKTMSTPVEHTEEAAPASVTRGAGTATSTTSHRAAAPAAHSAVRTSSTATMAAAVTAPAAKTADGAEAKPAPQAAPASTPAAPAPAAVATTNRTVTDDETLPIAGAIGLGVIALGGAAYAMNRRKRRTDEDELLLDTPTEAAPVAAAEPVTVAPRAAEAIPATAAPVAVPREAGPDRLPNGFDMSRFGRHTRAAYLGPTPDNPSHSLKRRLKRASFFDQREREAAAAGTMREPVYPESRAAQAAEADNGQVTIRMAPGRKPSNFGYVPQR
jgi:hypothetical protein